MIEALLVPESQAFAVALGLVVAIAALEVFGALVGLSASGAIDNMLPDVEADVDLGLDIDADFDVVTDIELSGGGALDADSIGVPDAPAPTALSAVLGWLCIGKVPVLLLLVMFLLAFGVTGVAVQWVSMGLLGVTLPGSLLLLPAFAAAIPFTRASGLLIARAIPKEESDAVSQREFIGKIAKIIRGVAKKGQPAEAKVIDSHGLTHYLLVEPDTNGVVFNPDDEIIVVGKSRSVYQVVRNTNPIMTSDTNLNQ